MSKTVKLRIEPMTQEAFSPYGEVWDAREHPADHRESFSVSYRPEGGMPTASIMWQPYQSLTFTKLERHFHATHVFIPLSGSPAAVAVALATDKNDPTAVPNPGDVRAFLIDGTKGFAYKKGTWHSLDRYILSPPGTTFVILNQSPNPTLLDGGARLAASPGEVADCGLHGGIQPAPPGPGYRLESHPSGAKGCGGSDF